MNVKKGYGLLALGICLCARVYAVRELILPSGYPEPGTYVKVYGSVRGFGFADSRQIYGVRDNYAAILPRPIEWSGPVNNPSENQRRVDLNACPQMGLSFLDSRLGVKFGTDVTPTWRGDGVIEGDFLGISNETQEHPFAFKLRYATVMLEHGPNLLLLGQFLHPMTLLDCYPHVVSSNRGAPFDIQAFAPQFRYVYTHEQFFRVLVTLCMQQGFASPGPLGPSPRYMQWVCAPAVDMQLHINSGRLLWGGGVDIKAIRPRIRTGGKNQDGDTVIVSQTDEMVVSPITMLFGSWTDEKASLRIKGFYAYNSPEQAILGGYGVCSEDKITGVREYVQLKAMGAWIDTDYKINKNWLVGGFFAAAKYLGGSCDFLRYPVTEDSPYPFKIYDTGYPLQIPVSCTFRVAPRVVWRGGPVEISGEVEVTEAMYSFDGALGTYEQNTSVVPNQMVTNTRCTLFISYTF